MVSVFYQIVYWLKNLTGLILTVRLESVKNVKFSLVKISRYTVLGLSDETWEPPLWVTNDDFLTAANKLKPSVSVAELETYCNLHRTINPEGKSEIIITMVTECLLTLIGSNNDDTPPYSNQ